MTQDIDLSQLLPGWAHFYAGQGMGVFPLVPRTKSPYAGSHGSSDASSDPARAAAHWLACPLSNIGSRPALAGHLVFDIDPRNGGWETVAALEAQHGPFKPALIVISPGGGEHWYFRTKPSVRYIGSPGPGVDIKHNGYVALPPSRHPNGGIYAWNVPPEQLPAALQAMPMAPEWLEQPARPERPARPAGPASDADLFKLAQALEHRDPESYESWAFAIASAKHLADNGLDAAYELVREWSAQSSKHDDGAFADKWASFDSDRPGARTLGSLLHEAGLTREQQELPPEVAFSEKPNVPAIRRVWTTAPVEGHGGSETPAQIYAAMVEKGQAPDVDGAVWWAAGNCQAAYEIMTQYGGAPESQALKDAIMDAAATRTTWRGVQLLTPEQAEAAAVLGVKRPELDVSNGKIKEATNTVIRALGQGAFPDIYQRSGRLVRVTDAGIVDVGQHTLAQMIETRLSVCKGKGKPAETPEGLLRRVLAAPAYPGVPELRGLAPSPVARPDGSILEAPGYDPVSGLFLRAAGCRPARVLSVEEAREALGRVWAPFALFPWADALAQGVFLSALFTTVCRPALSTAPAYLVNAQSAGTGKTLLGECLMLVAGAGTDAKPAPSRPEELEKSILPWLSSGEAGLLIDNVKGSLRDDGPLCAALTSARYTSRILGQSDVRTVEARALWVFTGNNVAIRGDMGRRVLRIDLLSPANAAQRHFQFDPRDMLGAGYRADLLDLLRTFGEYGCPEMPGRGLASYGEWDRLVRGAVQFFGYADPVAIIDLAREDDPEYQAEQAIVEAWKVRFGQEAVLLSEIQNRPMVGEAATLWAEAMDMLGERKLGYWLRARKNKDINGHKFMSHIPGGGSNTRRWSLIY